MRNLESIFDGAERTAPNPFREDVYASGITPVPGVTEIHGDAMTRCLRAFESLLSERGQGEAWAGSGRTLLLAAPRAGFGKSHLVGRVRAVTESLIAPIALPFDPARKVAWETMMVSVFNQYRSARCPQAPGCTLFEEVVRYFQSHLVVTAVEKGLIDRKEIPEADLALRLQFREIFDPKARTRMVPWLAKRSPEILDAVAPELCRRWVLEFDDLVFWNRFFQDASRPRTTAFEDLKALENEEARDRLTQFLRLASDCRPLAFLADHLDGFFGSETAGMQIAEILTELRFAVPRSVTLLCLNEDVWESIFEGRIPSAWIDRLTGEATPLREIEMEEAEGLLQERLKSAGYADSAVAAWLEEYRESCLESEGDWLSPREVLRRAAKVWDAGGETSPTQRPIDRPEPKEAVPDPTAPSKSVESPFRAPASSEELPPVKPASQSPPRSEDAPMKDPAFPEVESELYRFHRTSSEEASRRFPPPEAPSLPSDPPPSVPPSDLPPSRETATGHPSSPWQSPDDSDDRSAAARAAGIDPSRGLTEIDDIIADIRGQGDRALSETQSPGEGDAQAPPSSASQTAPSSPSWESGATTDSQGSGASGEPAIAPQVTPPATSPMTGNPFSAQDPGQRLETLEQLVGQSAPGGILAWEPFRVQRVISAVGAQFPAVQQQEEIVSFRSCLRWNVRGSEVRLGFEAPENFAFWNELLNRTISAESPGKIVLFSHPSVPFDGRSLAAMGGDAQMAVQFVDVVELTNQDLVRLYAAERFLEESQGEGGGSSSYTFAARIVASRLDDFWRRLGRSLPSGDRRL